jgi:hypothetical protein
MCTVPTAQATQPTEHQPRHPRTALRGRVWIPRAVSDGGACWGLSSIQTRWMGIIICQALPPPPSRALSFELNGCRPAIRSSLLASLLSGIGMGSIMPPQCHGNQPQGFQIAGPTCESNHSQHASCRSEAGPAAADTTHKPPNRGSQQAKWETLCLTSIHQQSQVSMAQSSEI